MSLVMIKKLEKAVEGYKKMNNLLKITYSKVRCPKVR